jgi:sugar O-acyltransferase (sialic acid O-acetyltransferase NeuD family)
LSVNLPSQPSKQVEVNLTLMKRVVIIGAGGHAREVAEIIRHQAQYESGLSVVGFVVDSEYLSEQRDPALSILGDWSWFEEAKRDDLAVICAIGDPVVRKRLVERAESLGLSFFSAISPAAHIFPSAKIGSGAMVFPKAVISTNVLLADHTVVNAGSTVSHDTRIERFGTLSPGVHLAGNVLISEGGYVGIGSSVTPGVSIGAWSKIGAGAAVADDIPGHVTAVGVPARILKTNRTA